MKIRPFNVSNPKPQFEPALDQSQIVQAALSLLDEVGFDGLTMRNLAKKLGIQAASLYWHVRSKQDLLRPPEYQVFSPGCALRSEEHTSELQSQSNLVCRLLLEKKKKK